MVRRYANLMSVSAQQKYMEGSHKCTTHNEDVCLPRADFSEGNIPIIAEKSIIHRIQRRRTHGETPPFTPLDPTPTRRTSENTERERERERESRGESFSTLCRCIPSFISTQLSVSWIPLTMNSPDWMRRCLTAIWKPRKVALTYTMQVTSNNATPDHKAP